MASPFKKAATFVCYFTAVNPVETLLPPEILGVLPQGQTAKARTTAVMALEIATESLHFATVQWENGETHPLRNAIQLSRHSFVDISDALTNATPVSSFKLVSVLFEQVSYKTNPSAQYPIE